MKAVAEASSSLYTPENVTPDARAIYNMVVKTLERGYVLTRSDLRAFAVACGRPRSYGANLLEAYAAPTILEANGVELVKQTYRKRVIYSDGSIPESETDIALVKQTIDEVANKQAEQRKSGPQLEYRLPDPDSTTPSLPAFSMVIPGGPVRGGSLAAQHFKKLLQRQIQDYQVRTNENGVIGQEPPSYIGALAGILTTGKSRILPSDREMIVPVPGHGVTFIDPHFERIHTKSGASSLKKLGLKILVASLLNPDIEEIQKNLDRCEWYGKLNPEIEPLWDV